jgi:hypothetical protein
VLPLHIHDLLLLVSWGYWVIRLGGLRGASLIRSNPVAKLSLRFQSDAQIPV